MAERSRLLELEDELLVQHIFSAGRGISLRDVASTCKRLCRMARSTVATITLEEGYAQHWPPVDTYTGCKGLEYLAPHGGVLMEAPGGADGFGLPLLSNVLPHVCQHWTILRELALVLQMEYPPGPHRQANQYLTAQLSALTAIHSLRHLQLYKTAPLQDDAAQLAQLTQLTSLLLADHSYMPGPAALVTVDLRPLSAMTNLRSVAISGVCPKGSAAAKGAAVERLAYEQRALGPGNPNGAAIAAASFLVQDLNERSAAGEVLPNSLTSLVLKNFDADGLDLWTLHVQRLKMLQHLDVISYSEPSGSRAFECFPAPLVAQLAPTLTALTHLSFSHVSHENERVRAGYAATAVQLPRSISQLQQLRTLELTWCPLSLQSEGDWAAVAALTNLTILEGIDLGCVASMDMTFTNLRRLSFTNYPSRYSGQWCLAAACPQLEELKLAFHCSSDMLAAATPIAAIGNLTRLDLDFLFRLDEASAAAFLQLGQKLQQLDALSVAWAGGPDGWLLPRLHTFTQIGNLMLAMHMPGKRVPADCYDPWQVTDTAFLACLSPLMGLEYLLLYRMPAVTPAVLVGLQGMMPKLRALDVIECSGVQEGPAGVGWDAGPDWAGPDLQLALAAMQDAARFGRPNVSVEGFTRASDFINRAKVLPCDIRYVTTQGTKF